MVIRKTHCCAIAALLAIFVALFATAISVSDRLALLFESTPSVRANISKNDALDIAIGEVVSRTGISRDSLAGSVDRSGDVWHAMIYTDVVGEFFIVVVDEGGQVRAVHNVE